LILRLKCTKFDFSWGSAPDPAGEAYSASPDSLAGFKGLLLREGREGKGRQGRDLRGLLLRGERGGEGKGGEGIALPF